MGNKTSQKSKYNLLDNGDLRKFLFSINLLDGFYTDTNLRISSKCLVIINNLINHHNLTLSDNQPELIIENDDEIHYSGHQDHNDVKYDYHICELAPNVTARLDNEIMADVELLKFNCQLIRHLVVYNSSAHSVEEFIELNNLSDLVSLRLENLPVQFVQHLKRHRKSMLKMSVHGSITSLRELVESCGGDHSYSENWINLLLLDVRFNRLQAIDQSVTLLTALTVLDISKNEIVDLSFLSEIPTLVCLNASFNSISNLPVISRHSLRVLILGYNNLESVEGIKYFKNLTTLNLSYNVISSCDYLQQLRELDLLADLVLRGNPICYSKIYRSDLLNVISPRVPHSFAIDGQPLSHREEHQLHNATIIRIAPASDGSYLGSSFLSSPPSIFRRAQQHQLRGGGSTPVHIITPGRTPVSGEGAASSSGVVNHRIVRHAPLESQSRFASQWFTSAVLDTTSTLIKPPLPPTERHIVVDGQHDTDYETAQTDYSSSQSEHIPYFVSDKTVSVNLRSADGVANNFLFDVSVQLIEHRLMSVDSHDQIVDNADCWRMLLVSTETNHLANRVRLIFLDQVVTGSKSYELRLESRTVHFKKSEELTRFRDQISHYTSGFRVLHKTHDGSGDADWPLSGVHLLCTSCEISVRPPVGRSSTEPKFCCQICQKKAFVLDEVTATAGSDSNKNPTSVLQATFNMLDNQSHTQLQSPLYPLDEEPMSPGQDDDDEAEAQFGHSFEDSNNTSFMSTKQDSEVTMFFSPEENNFDNNLNNMNSSENLEEPSTLKIDSGSSEILGEAIPNTVGQQVFAKAMQIHTQMAGTGVSLQSPLDCLLRHASSPWIIEQPLSGTTFHMYRNSAAKIDGRIKLHFLTRVMTDNEDIIAAFKVYAIHKFPCEVATDALLVLSNERLILYAWTDKKSDNLEDCLRYLVEYKMKHMVQMEFSLNNQWLELQFKSVKQTLLLFIGDSEATKNIGSQISDITSSSVVKFSVRSQKSLEHLKANQIFADIANLNVGTTQESLVQSQSFLLRSCSVIVTNKKVVSEFDYAPLFMIVEAENLFFVTIKFSSKDSQQPKFNVETSLSLYSLHYKLLIDKHNTGACVLQLFDNGLSSTVRLEFFSASSRSCALTLIGRLWQVVLLSELQFEFTTE